MRAGAVLVTGATGFVGAPTLAALPAAGHEVHAVTTRSEPPELPGVQWHRLDLADAAATAQLCRELRPEHLLHLAWYVEHGKFWEARENTEWVARSLALLRAFAAAGGRRAVLLGTCAEYDWSGADGPLRERDSPLAPASLYGRSKDRLRRRAETLAAEEGFDLAWARLFFMYGPREPPERIVAAVICALLASEPVKTTSGSQRRDFIHVDDVGRALAALLDSGVCGPVNVASGEAPSIAELIDTIAASVGADGLVERGALPDRPGEPPLLLADVTRLREEVGFTPQLDLASGITQTVDWWRGRLGRR